jgi:hypothetical protein
MNDDDSATIYVAKSNVTISKICHVPVGPKRYQPRHQNVGAVRKTCIPVGLMKRVSPFIKLCFDCDEVLAAFGEHHDISPTTSIFELARNADWTPWTCGASQASHKMPD